MVGTDKIDLLSCLVWMKTDGEKLDKVVEICPKCPILGTGLLIAFSPFVIHSRFGDFEDGTAIYKKKHWFYCSFSDLYKLVRQRKFRKTFTLHTETFIGKCENLEKELANHV